MNSLLERSKESNQSSSDKRSGTSLQAMISARSKIPHAESFLDFKKCQGDGPLFHLLAVVLSHVDLKPLLSDWRECLYTFRIQKKRGGKTFKKPT